MIYLRNLLSIIAFVFLLFIELIINTVLNFDYFLIMPFFIGMFVISTRRFSNFYISVFLVAGIYYDALYSSNILGFSSAKFLITMILMNFIVANQQNTNVTPPAKEDSLAAQGIKTEKPQQIERISWGY